MNTEKPLDWQSDPEYLQAKEGQDKAMEGFRLISPIAEPLNEGLDEPVAEIELEADLIKPLTNAMRICAKVAKLYVRNNGTEPNFVAIPSTANHKRRKGVSVAHHNYVCPKCYRSFVGPLHAICKCPVEKPRKAEDAA